MFTEAVPTVYQSSKTVKNNQNTVKTAQKWPLVYQSSHVYQDCTNRVPTVYQKQSKDSQHRKHDHWCTNRHMSTKTVPTMYQSSKTVKTAQKWPLVLVYQSSQVYQDCTNSVTIVYNRQQELSYRTQYVEGIHRPKYYTVTLKYRLWVTQSHWKRNHWRYHTRLTISRVIWR